MGGVVTTTVLCYMGLILAPRGRGGERGRGKGEKTGDVDEKSSGEVTYIRRKLK